MADEEKSEVYTKYLSPENFFSFLNSRFGDRLHDLYSATAGYELKDRLWFPKSNKKVLLRKGLSLFHPDYLTRNVVRVANLKYTCGEYSLESFCDPERVFEESLWVKVNSSLSALFDSQEFSVSYSSSPFAVPTFKNISGKRQFNFHPSSGWDFSKSGF